MIYTLINRARLNLYRLKEAQREQRKMEREKEIVKISMIGIFVNAVLVAFKLAVGFLSHSIAIILDGINNLTDALSSVVTIIGTKLRRQLN